MPLEADPSSALTASMNIALNVGVICDRAVEKLFRLRLGIFGRLARWCVRIAFSRVQIVVHHAGIRYEGGHMDRVFLHRLAKSTFEPYMTRLLQDSLRPGMVFIDVGSYLGYYSLVAAKVIGPKGRCYAFEPSIAAYHQLEQNIKKNGYLRTVIPTNAAVSDNAGVSDFFIRGTGPSMNSLAMYPKHWRKARYQVRTVTLDDYFHYQHLDVVKVDVEGPELSVIRGMKHAFQSGQSMVLFVEFNPEMQDAFESNATRSMLRLLEDNRFTVRFIDEERQSLVPLDIERHQYGNLHCTRF